MVLDEVAHYLAAQGLGVVKTASNTPTWPIYKGGVFGNNPDIPDAIMVAVGPGDPPQDEMGGTAGAVPFENPSLVVQVRSASYSTADTKAQAIWAKLHKFVGSIGSPAVRYLLIRARQSPFPVGRDDTDRWLIGFNCDVSKERS
jgi:hypothetical protein